MPLRARNDTIWGRLWTGFKVGIVFSAAILAVGVAIDFVLSWFSSHAAGVSLAGVVMGWEAFFALPFDVLLIKVGALIVHLLAVGIVISILYEYGQEAGWW